MDTTILWLIIGGAVAVAGVSVVLLQKKAAEARKYLVELTTIQTSLADKQRGLDEVEKNLLAKLSEAKDAAQRLHSELKDEKAKAAQRIQELSEQLDASKTEQGQVQELTRSLTEAQQERDQKAAALADRDKRLQEQASRDSAEAEKLAEELAAVKTQLRDKSDALIKLEKEFEEQMDDVVQSSLQKITHAEEAKEEAVQAAQDNYEAAAEAHAQLREKDALIKKLQGV